MCYRTGNSMAHNRMLPHVSGSLKSKMADVINPETLTHLTRSACRLIQSTFQMQIPWFYQNFPLWEVSEANFLESFQKFSVNFPELLSIGLLFSFTNTVSRNSRRPYRHRTSWNDVQCDTSLVCLWIFCCFRILWVWQKYYNNFWQKYEHGWFA